MLRHHPGCMCIQLFPDGVQTCMTSSKPFAGHNRLPSLTLAAHMLKKIHDPMLFTLFSQSFTSGNPRVRDSLLLA